MAEKNRAKATQDGLMKLLEKTKLEWNKQIILPAQERLSKKEERLKWQRMPSDQKLGEINRMGREQWEELMRELYGETK